MCAMLVNIDDTHAPREKRSVTAFAFCDVIPHPARVTVDDDDFAVISDEVFIFVT